MLMSAYKGEGGKKGQKTADIICERSHNKVGDYKGNAKSRIVAEGL